MDVLSRKFRGATLIEALVAIIVVAITFVMSAMIYTNIISTDNSFQKLEANSMIGEIVADTYVRSDFIDTTFEKDSITITKIISHVSNRSRAIVLSIRAYGAGKKVLASYNELILR